MSKRWLLPLVFLAVLAVGVVALPDRTVLYEKASPYNNILVTEDEQGLRTLWFEKGGSRQSVVKPGDPDHLDLAYAKVMPVALAFVDKPRRILIVGLGGGTIPNFLHRHYPAATIDVVDIDPDVVAVAKKYFGFHEDAAMRAHVMDGRRFIEECREPYDIIFLDAFGSDAIPYHLATREFLQAARRAVSPGGVIAGNIWSRFSNRLHDSMIRTYQDVFETLYVFDVRGAGNEILIALPRDARVDRAEVVRRAARIAKEHRFQFDLGDLVHYGYDLPDPDDFDAAVLVDADEDRWSQ